MSPSCYRWRAALPSALLIHAFPRLRRALDPLLASYYAVPFFVFYPLFIVLFGLGRGAVVAIGFLFGVVAMIIATLNGFDRIPRVLVQHRAGLPHGTRAQPPCASSCRAPRRICSPG